MVVIVGRHGWLAGCRVWRYVGRPSDEDVVLEQVGEALYWEERSGEKDVTSFYGC
jgi:hypothetical protein